MLGQQSQEIEGLSRDRIEERRLMFVPIDRVGSGGFLGRDGGHREIAPIPKDEVTVLVTLPLFHSFGQTCIQNASIAAGGSFTLLPRFTPKDAFEIMLRDRVASPGGTTGKTTRVPFSPPIARVDSIGMGVGQSMGHCELLMATRMR